MLAAVVVVTALATIGRVAHATDRASVQVTNDTSRLPTHLGVVIHPLSPSDSSVALSGSDAINAAEAGFALRDHQVDSNIGLVRALTRLRGASPPVDHKSVVVTFDAGSYGHSPVLGHLWFRKLCVVVNAASGKWEYAYQADPATLGPTLRVMGRGKTLQ